MTTPQHSRRSLLVAITSALGISAFGRKAAAAAVTPSAGEGPFYPTPAMRKSDIDSDLVKIEGAVRQAGGDIFILRGKINDQNGQPLVGHRIEIWQCDLDGNYMHPRDARSVNFDQAFQGFGHDVTDTDGRYSFRTIKPTSYPGRTPHIHVKIISGERELLTTQFYIKNDPGNARDGLFRRMSVEEADAVSMEFVDTDDGSEATVDIIV